MGASYVEAMAFQDREGDPYFELGWMMDKDADHVQLTVAEARTLAESVVRTCDAIEAAQR